MREYLLLSLCLLVPSWCFSFVGSPRHPRRHTFTQQPLLPEATSWIATIDADIANIPENEFAPVFMGGIVVMFGGLISAMAVGFMLEKGDLYANVVADSYVQQGNDEEFWKGLSEEEKVKGQEILQQLEAKSKGKALAEDTEIIGDSTPSEKEMDMFSDYE